METVFSACGFDELAKRCSLQQIHDICHEYYYGKGYHFDSTDSGDLYPMAKCKYQKALAKYQAEQRQ